MTTAPTSSSHTLIAFPSGGVSCAGWHFPATSSALTGPSGTPVVVMAHGLGGTMDSGLVPFAEGLAAAGLDVLSFDYRGFGHSDAAAGSPRQQVTMEGQLDDYRAAMKAAAALPGVDPSRLVLWGVSLAGGHVIAAGAGRDDVAAVISLTPLVDGMAAGRHALASHTKSSIAKSTVAGLRSKVASKAGRGPVTMPIVGRPGDVAALSLSGCYEDYLSIAGPTWVNEIDAAVGLELGGHRPGKLADQLTCPTLVQIADFDRSAPPQAAAKAAFAARAEVRHYPCDHFDVWPGKDWFAPALAHQVLFLTHHLT